MRVQAKANGWVRAWHTPVNEVPGVEIEDKLHGVTTRGRGLEGWGRVCHRHGVRRQQPPIRVQAIQSNDLPGHAVHQQFEIRGFQIQAGLGVVILGPGCQFELGDAHLDLFLQADARALALFLLGGGQKGCCDQQSQHHDPWAEPDHLAIMPQAAPALCMIFSGPEVVQRGTCQESNPAGPHGSLRVAWASNSLRPLSRRKPSPTT